MTKNTDHLLEIMVKLRDPSGGCPWDVEQNFKSIAPYTIEEAYEVADAIARGNMTDLKNELGDLLFQVIFHAQLASEAGHFTYEDVVNAISEKMVRRHPHVFSDAMIESADAQTSAWEDIKAQERLGSEDKSVLADVPVAMPALTRAEKLQKRAARVGFDWDDPERVLDKIKEEVAEVEAETSAALGGDRDGMAEEIGDLLFACVNLARKWGVDPETALRRGNEKFERRFRAMEAYFQGTGTEMASLSLEEMENAWVIIKNAQREAPSS